MNLRKDHCRSAGRPPSPRGGARSAPCEVSWARTTAAARARASTNRTHTLERAMRARASEAVGQDAPDPVGRAALCRDQDQRSREIQQYNRKVVTTGRGRHVESRAGGRVRRRLGGDGTGGERVRNRTHPRTRGARASPRDRRRHDDAERARARSARPEAPRLPRRRPVRASVIINKSRGKSRTHDDARLGRGVATRGRRARHRMSNAPSSAIWSRVRT